MDFCIRVQEDEKAQYPNQTFKIQSYKEINTLLSEHLIEAYSSMEFLAIYLTIEMTLFTRAPPELLMQIKENLGSEKRLIELVMVISGYNCVSRFLIAMDIHLPDGLP